MQDNCHYLCLMIGQILSKNSLLFWNSFLSFDSPTLVPSRTFMVDGILHNKNTIDGFKTCDKQEMMKGVSNQVGIIHLHCISIRSRKTDAGCCYCYMFNNYLMKYQGFNHHKCKVILLL